MKRETAFWITAGLLMILGYATAHVFTALDSGWLGALSAVSAAFLVGIFGSVLFRKSWPLEEGENE